MNFKKDVSNPETSKDIDIYAGKGSIHHMEAYYRYLMWSNSKNLFLVKSKQETLTLKMWGPLFGVQFKLYVASLPEKSKKVSDQLTNLS